jgi:hypothetical protein
LPALAGGISRAGLFCTRTVARAVLGLLYTRSHALRGNAVSDALRRLLWAAPRCRCGPGKRLAIRNRRRRGASRTAFPRRAWERVASTDLEPRRYRNNPSIRSDALAIVYSLTCRCQTAKSASSAADISSGSIRSMRAILASISARSGGETTASRPVKAPLRSTGAIATRVPSGQSAVSSRMTRPFFQIP